MIGQYVAFIGVNDDARSDALSGSGRGLFRHVEKAAEKRVVIEWIVATTGRSLYAHIDDGGCDFL